MPFNDDLVVTDPHACTLADRSGWSISHPLHLKRELQLGPSVVGREGVSEVLCPDLTDEETRALERSAETLRKALAKYAASG